MKHADRQDYLLALQDVSISHALARQQTLNETDQISMPLGHYKFMLGKSPIDGQGIFATANIQPNEVIGPGRINGKRTPIGRYTNHSVLPNARMTATNGDIYLIAAKPIQGQCGGMRGDEITVDYRQSIAENVKSGELCQE